MHQTPSARSSTGLLRMLGTALAAALLLAAPALRAQDDAGTRLHRLFDDYWETLLRESPTFATTVGDARYNDRLDDLSAQAVRRRKAQIRDWLRQLGAFDASALPDRDRVSLATLQFELQAQERINTLLGDLPLEAGRETPLSHQDGIQFSFPQIVRDTQFARVRDYEDYLKRLAAVPRYLEQLTEQLRVGLAAGWTPPRITLRDVPAQFDALASADPKVNPAATPFRDLPADLPAAERQRLARAGEAAVRDVVAPAFARLQGFLRDTYLPGARTDLAASDLPGGTDYYAARLLQETTTTLTARQIHELGLREVARIEAAMDKIQRAAGYADRAQFRSYLLGDPKFFFTTAEAMLAAYRDIAKRIDPQLPALFRELPRLPYGIRAMSKEEGDNSEHYTPGTADGSRAGYFEANTNHLRGMPRWDMTTLVLHEAVPGHHLQVSRAQEIAGLPRFQRELGNDAYVEGWALYAESLGARMGMFDDPLDLYGHLSDELLRATRLVVDTGVHALGWSREQTLQYMREHTSLAEVSVVAETDRYIAWPAQATAYKVGQLHIMELRDKAQAALGDAFDIRGFHNALLDSGAVPMTVLDGIIDRWIAAQRAAAAHS